MSQYLDNLKPNFEKVLEFFKKEVASLRVGRASPALLENVQVNAYETMTPLIQLASIQVPEPRCLVIQPWDKSLIKQIAKAINEADLSVNAMAEDQLVRVNIPTFSEETRKEVIKKLHQKMEVAKVGVKNQREKIKEEVIKLEKNKEISEDEKFKRIEELDNLVKKYNEQIRELGEKKETEILTI